MGIKLGRHLGLLGFLAILGALAVGSSMALQGDRIADRVLGQYNFTVAAPNYVDASGLSLSNQVQGRVAIDLSVSPNRVYVVDSGNNRVLGWSNADNLTNGAPADLVIGQTDFHSNLCNAGGAVSAGTLCSPTGAGVDAQGRLYVADTGNNRVLEYDSPYSGPPAADRVFGQNGNFSLNSCTTTAVSLCRPQGVAVDLTGRLYVADTYNSRILQFDAPLTSQSANRVFGQSGSFTTKECHGGYGLCYPTSVAPDFANHLYVADTLNHRVLEYDVGSPSDILPDVVFGQKGRFDTA